MDRRGEMTDVTHIHAARNAADVMFGAELRALHERHEDYRYRQILTAEQGRFELAALAELQPDWAERQTWACGPAALLDAIERHWAAAGVADRLHVERFDIELDDVRPVTPVSIITTMPDIEPWFRLTPISPA